MPIPTEPIGSLPRPEWLLAAQRLHDGVDPALDPLYEEAIRDTIRKQEAVGCPVVTDGEQRKYHNFWTYCVHGMRNMNAAGFRIPFSAGHVRRMPRLTAGPFRYRRYADAYLTFAQRCARVPVKQAVISASALSLLYPQDELPDYPRRQFIDDLLDEHETEVRRCLRRGAHTVQVDFAEARLAVELDPRGELLQSFIDLNNLALTRFDADDRRRIGVYTCPDGDGEATHATAADLLPLLFELRADNFYIALAGAADPERVLTTIARHLKPHQRAFIGVISPGDPRVETAEIVRDRVLRAARHIAIEQLGTTDDCGFAPFCDDTATSREVAFAKIRARVEGTALAARVLGVA